MGKDKEQEKKAKEQEKKAKEQAEKEKKANEQAEKAKGKEKGKDKDKKKKGDLPSTFGQLGSGSKVGSQPLTAQAKDARRFHGGHRWKNH